MLHPQARLFAISNDIGIVATALLPLGTIVWTLDALDFIVDAATVRALPPLVRTKLDRLARPGADGVRILPWDLARYMRCAADPSTRMVGRSFAVARRDIVAGEWLTRDVCIGDAPASSAAADAGHTCTGAAIAGPLSEQNAELGLAIRAAREVAQPLLKYAQPLAGDRLYLKTFLGEWG